MATITRYFVVDFGPRYSGLATVGYTLPGGSRTTSGVTELHAGTGAYGATISYDSSLSGALKWDTGGGSPVFAFEDVSPLEACKLTSDGLDAIEAEDGLNLRQSVSLILAASVGKVSGASNAASQTIVIRAADDPSTTRITAACDRYGNRSTVTLAAPA